MPYVTLSPVPVSGGTLILPQRRHMCRLTDTRYFCIYGQTGPNYTFGMVAEVDVRSTNPTSTILRTQTIPELTTTYTGVVYKVKRLNDTDVLVFQQIGATTVTCSVLRIDPVTNIITRVGNQLTYNNITNYALDQPSYRTSIEVVGDDNVLVSTPTATNLFTIVKYTWTPGTDTLSRVTIAQPTLVGIGSTSVHKTPMVSKSRDGNTWCLGWSFSPSGNTSFTSYLVTNRYIIDPVDNTWQAYAVTAQQAFPAWLPVDSTKHLLIKDSCTWKEYNGGTGPGVDITFCPTGVANAANRNTYVTWLNQDYFLILTSAKTSGTYYPTYSGSTGFYARVVKYTDASTGDTSSSTTSDLLIADSDFSIPFYTDSYEYISPDVVLIYGIATTTGAFKMGILYSGS